MTERLLFRYAPLAWRERGHQQLTNLCVTDAAIAIRVSRCNRLLVVLAILVLAAASAWSTLGIATTAVLLGSLTGAALLVTRLRWYSTSLTLVRQRQAAQLK